ncbi:MAG: hypothetical protein GY796_15105 [Chloroflexi bacterium]|nr:hypothetical protein [Chloroflexota bacterium]
MADYFTQFVVSIDNVSSTGKAWAEQAYPALHFYPEREADDPPHTWTMQINSDISLDLDEVIDFAQSYLIECDPDGVVTVEWANSCNKMRPNGFGGGAAVVTATEVQYLATHEWIAQRLAVLSGGMI